MALLLQAELVRIAFTESISSENFFVNGDQLLLFKRLRHLFLFFYLGLLHSNIILLFFLLIDLIKDGFGCAGIIVRNLTTVPLVIGIIQYLFILVGRRT